MRRADYRRERIRAFYQATLDAITEGMPRPKVPEHWPIQVLEPQTEDERTYWALRARAPEERN